MCNGWTRRGAAVLLHEGRLIHHVHQRCALHEFPEDIGRILGSNDFQEFELAVEGRALILEPRPEQMTVKLVGRTPVFEGTLPPGDVDWVAEVRGKRDRDILAGERS